MKWSMATVCAIALCLDLHSIRMLLQQENNAMVIILLRGIMFGLFITPTILNKFQTLRLRVYLAGWWTLLVVPYTMILVIVLSCCFPILFVLKSTTPSWEYILDKQKSLKQVHDVVIACKLRAYDVEIFSQLSFSKAYCGVAVMLSIDFSVIVLHCWWPVGITILVGLHLSSNLLRVLWVMLFYNNSYMFQTFLFQSSLGDIVCRFLNQGVDNEIDFWRTVKAVRSFSSLATLEQHLMEKNSLNLPELDYAPDLLPYLPPELCMIASAYLEEGPAAILNFGG
jgi:hypothetical protein